MRLNPLERRLRPRSLEIGSRRGRGALASKDGVVKPISAYRAKLYCLIFSLAALYNIAFGLWACLWPRAFFTSLAMALIVNAATKELLSVNNCITAAVIRMAT